jgi:hypothetical protein
MDILRIVWNTDTAKWGGFNVKRLGKEERDVFYGATTP